MGDLAHCPLCDRDKELLENFWTELENDRMEHCTRCQETWFDMGLKNGICKRCIARDKNKKVGWTPEKDNGPATGKKRRKAMLSKTSCSAVEPRQRLRRDSRQQKE
ncbi:hypothetical protein HIM_09915 [Hirsutella minnesotensis 3608]|uniref:Uncharacterized protein n=1 Tax=Hirsutella minnesotensis 3608 TaxID=1043627 RepID=A0A0F7ZGD3_9HYPO|nr:hypothetical protein HIM_09915 [Hirsutella minnesotensis 3608]